MRWSQRGLHLALSFSVALGALTPAAVLAYDRQEARYVQGVIGTAADGVIGPITEARAADWLARHPEAGLPALTTENADESLPLWAGFLKRAAAAEIDLTGLCGGDAVTFSPEGQGSPFYGIHRGVWDSGVPHQLMVTRISAGGAEGFYAAGEPFSQCWPFAGAGVAGDTMTVAWPSSGIAVTYVVVPGDALEGSYAATGLAPVGGEFFTAPTGAGPVAAEPAPVDAPAGETGASDAAADEAPPEAEAPAAAD